MSKQAPITPEADDTPARIAIVGSRYNRRYTDAMVDACTKEITTLLPNATVEVHRVPGAFEIPVVVERLCISREPKLDAVVALGVIIRGSTAHADLIAASITDALQASARTHLLPVIHEVLLLDNTEQAEERSLGDKLNRGREAAQSAAEMIGVMRFL
jgi:6,7-dimethyl-8-ribityllumazine synthase